MKHEQSESAPADSTLQQYLTFSLAEEEYAVEILKVQEIRSWSEPTPLPHSPDYVLGVMNLRGAIIPVVDLRRQFQLASVPPTSITGVIVVNTSILGRERSVGLVVDQVLNVIYLEPEPVAHATDPDGNPGSCYITGLCRSDDKLVIVIDLQSIIATSLNLTDAISQADEAS
ncbi:MAG: chemotaxis protein CheW [bacterium]